MTRATQALEKRIGEKTLVAYRQEYVTALGAMKPGKIAWKHVEARVKAGRRVLLGDQHDHAGFQELALEVMELMDSPEDRPTLVIEFIQERFQPVLDRYLAGKATDSELRKQAYDLSGWPFSWRSYRAILARAKSMGWKVVAVEPPGSESLAKRDTRIAAAVSRIEGRVLVFYGAYHLLGKRHLADRIDPDLVITPVAEDHHWSLLRAGGGNPRAVSLGDEVIFVNVANPLDSGLPYLKTLMESLDIAELEDVSLDHPAVGDCPCEEE